MFLIASAALLKKHLSNVTVVSFGKIVTDPSIEKWRAHSAEQERPEIFHSEVEKFLQTVKYLKA